MTAEQYIPTWLTKKYPGAKEIGDWTPEDVVEFAEAYHDYRITKETMTEAVDISSRYQGKSDDPLFIHRRDVINRIARGIDKNMMKDIDDSTDADDIDPNK